MHTKCTIYVIQHGQSEENILEDQNRVGNYDDLESSLSEKGREQAKHLSNKLKDIHFHAVWSSDLSRAYETALIIKGERNISVQQDRSIREIHYGKYHKQFSKIRAQFEASVRLLPENEKMKYKFEDIETEEHAMMRLYTFVQKLASNNSGQTIALVNHGKNMRMLLIKLGFGTYDEVPRGLCIGS
ncbi:MAG: histidine phosphatase family protein [Candidatus Roizmanbacteria bacterium]